MRPTQQFSVTVINEMADAVYAKVASGEWATESKVSRDGVRAHLACDRAVEEWLRRDVAAALQAMKDNPARAVSPDRVKARLAAAAKKARARTSNAP